VDIGPVTPEFKSLNAYTHRRSAVWLGSLGISIQFSFSYSLEDVTVMPRGLHARLCHAFLFLILQ